VTEQVDLELVTIERLTELPKRPLRELWPDALTPLDGAAPLRVYVYRQMVPDPSDPERKRRIPRLNSKGEPWVKRFVERTQK
jgi:hypothetical protein